MAAVELAFRRVGGEGGGDAPVALVLHGLLGQGRNWQAIARRLAGPGRALLLVDLRNHGRSPRAAPTTYPAMVEDLAALLGREGIGRASVVGHSMGGKAAMAMALLRPGLVDRLAVVDVAPVAYRHAAFRGYLEAMRAVDLAAPGRRAAVEAALIPADPDPRVRAFLASNLEAGPDGSLRWLPDLDRLLADLDSILGFPEALLEGPAFDGPTLFLAGAASDYLRAEHEPAALRLFPRAAVERVEGAGHWVHADRPEAAAVALDAFLPRA